MRFFARVMWNCHGFSSGQFDFSIKPFTIPVTHNEQFMNTEQCNKRQFTWNEYNVRCWGLHAGDVIALIVSANALYRNNTINWAAHNGNFQRIGRWNSIRKSPNKAHSELNKYARRNDHFGSSHNTHCSMIVAWAISVSFTCSQRLRSLDSQE